MLKIAGKIEDEKKWAEESVSIPQPLVMDQDSGILLVGLVGTCAAWCRPGLAVKGTQRSLRASIVRVVCPGNLLDC
jgi:hypothetical protein